MKVGDLVTMPGCHLDVNVDLGIGLVVDLGPVPHRPNTCNRVGVMWTDGEGVDYEPVAWLEVISEGR